MIRTVITIEWRKGESHLRELTMAPVFLFSFAAYRAKLSQLARKVGWVGHCLRQLDHVAAQRVRRTHQWVTFNNRIWPGKVLRMFLSSFILSSSDQKSILFPIATVQYNDGCTVHSITSKKIPRCNSEWPYIVCSCQQCQICVWYFIISN